MIREWLKKTSLKPCWESFYFALKGDVVGDEVVAVEMANMYIFKVCGYINPVHTIGNSLTLYTLYETT